MSQESCLTTTVVHAGQIWGILLEFSILIFSLLMVIIKNAAFRKGRALPLNFMLILKIYQTYGGNISSSPSGVFFSDLSSTVWKWRRSVHHLSGFSVSDSSSKIIWLSIPGIYEMFYLCEKFHCVVFVWCLAGGRAQYQSPKMQSMTTKVYFLHFFTSSEEGEFLIF